MERRAQRAQYDLYQYPVYLHTSSHYKRIQWGQIYLLRSTQETKRTPVSHGLLIKVRIFYIAIS